MSQSPLRFSLRTLLVAMTLIAIVIGTTASNPIVLVISLLLMSPLFFAAAMAQLFGQRPK
jgi:hypothetical protein